MSEKKEYIERGALLSAIGEERAVLNGLSEYGYLKVIREVPAADVEPAVRGEWETLIADLTDFSRESYVHWLKCSLCDKAIPLRFKSKFCPHCGAHMLDRYGLMPFNPQSVEDEKKACADYFERKER